MADVDAGGEAGAGACNKLPAPAAEPAAGGQEDGEELQPGAAAGAPRAVRPPRRVFRYGNYSGYYGYRVGDAREDHRLLALRREWFEGRRCLDVGCNEGLVPLTLAVRYRTASFLGVDIDASLVARARATLRRLRAAAVDAAADAGAGAGAGAAAVGGMATLGSGRTELASAGCALAGCSFAHANFLSLPLPDGSVDTVLCLSVSKWVHLNWGDAGVEALFGRCLAALAPGGVLLLEPQPWRSYRAAFRKQRMPAETLANFKQLRLRPDGFAEVLLRAGFSRVEALRPTPGGAGFDRPLLCAHKAAAPG